MRSISATSRFSSATRGSGDQKRTPTLPSPGVPGEGERSWRASHAIALGATAGEFIPAMRYKMFTHAPLREVVLTRLAKQLVETRTK